MKKNSGNPIVRILILSIFFFAFFALFSMFFGGDQTTEELTYNEFVTVMNSDEVAKLQVAPENSVYIVTGQYKTEEGEKDKYFTSTVPTESAPAMLEVAEKNDVPMSWSPEKDPSNFGSFLFSILLFGGMFFLITRMMGGKNGPMAAGEHKARLNVQSGKMFSDVVGYEEEKQELVEIIDFLKNPTLYQEMGAKIPNGVLLEGPPGTGKTLMAKAVAGEANVPFYSISGSDFIEMFVGVGASRVRSLFKEAKKNGPCIVFIDEIDAIGSRDSGAPGGRNTEQEQTINALLVELDGFASAAPGEGSIIIIGATNRADKLDPALLRPGRFDRKVIMGLPDIASREKILLYHASFRKFDESVNFYEIAKSTTGMSGAQLEAVVNEAAILAVREKQKIITQDLLEEAIDRVLMGPAKISNKYSDADKKIVSFHETGHAIIGLSLADGMQVQKITIVPRGDAGGYVAYAPKEDEERFTTRRQLVARMTSLLGGRASEELFIGDISVGAHNDFEQATRIARAMVTKFGMSDLGLTQLEQNNYDGPYSIKQYSEDTATKIDAEVKKLLDECYSEATRILTERKEDVYLLANAIQEVESMTMEEIAYLIEHKTLKEKVIVEKFSEEEIEDIRKKAEPVIETENLENADATTPVEPKVETENENKDA